MSRKSENPKIYSSLEKFPVRDPVPEPFVNNVRSFLQEFCKRENYESAGVTSSVTYLVNKRHVVIPLYVFQEDVEKIRKPVCYPCNSSGWGSCFQSRARFHFVIPSLEKWAKPIEAGVLECKTHIMHGFIHSNGYGHLLTIKGSGDGGSHLIDLVHLNNLWDRICCSLHARAISVKEKSRDRGMETRLLYSIAYGPSWTGYEGYEVHFPNQNANVLKERYEESVVCLQNIQLESPDTIQIAKRYHVPTPTPRHLFLKLIYLQKDRPEFLAKCPDFSQTLKRFVPEKLVNKHVKKAIQIVDYMKKNKSQGGSFTANEIHQQIRGPGLVNTVLAHIQDTTVDKVVVRKMKTQNEVSYYIEDLCDLNQVHGDLKRVYDHISSLDAVKEELKTVLQSRVLIRTYGFNDYNVGVASNMVCAYKETGSVVTNEGIHVVLPPNKTAGEIKRIIQETWRNVYTLTKNIVVSEISGFQGDDDTIYMMVDSVEAMIVGGPVFGDRNMSRVMMYEGGWVHCACCRQDHRDGKLIQCHRCQILGHRKCYGIGDQVYIPMFLCSDCYNSLRA